MKKVLFVVIVALCATTIVKAENPFAYLPPQGKGFFLPEKQGKMTPAQCRAAFLALFAKEEDQDEEEIYKYFQRLPGVATSELKEIYRVSFEKRYDVDEITDAEIRKIFTKMKFRKPDDDYWQSHKSMYVPKGATTYDDMDWFSPGDVREGEQIGSCSLDGVDIDLVSTHCGNPVTGCPPKKQPKKPIKEEEKPEDVYITHPGHNTYINNLPDTVWITSSKVTIDERNNTTIIRVKNRVSEVDDNETELTANNDVEERCGCDKHHVCSKHKEAYERYYKKDRKKFFNTFGGKLLIYTAGVFTGMFIENNVHIGGHHGGGNTITQGPFSII
jgi:hypothetical protein